MNLVLQRSLFSLALLCWGGVILYFHVSGRIVKYLAPDFRVIALAGGLGLVVVGLFILLTARQEADCGHDHGPGGHHDHETLDIHPLAALAILLVPLFAAVGWTRDSYSLQALGAKGLHDSPQQTAGFLDSILPPLTREIIEQQHPPDETGHHPFSLIELFFSSADSEMRGLIEGMKVTTEGRLVSTPDGPPGDKRLYRLFITCCAADSRPVPILARWDGAAPAFEENTWVTLSGTITYPDEGEGPVPVLEVSRAEATEAPPEESFMRGY